MTLQVLVTTINKSIDEIVQLYYKMHLSGDAIFGNQCGHDNITNLIINEHQVIVVDQSTVGTSRNRNAIMSLSTADLIAFMDDDVVLVDDFEQIIFLAFAAHPRATSIRFNMESKNSARPIRQHGSGISTFRDVISYGVWGLVLHRQKIVNKHLSFNEDFGPGTTFFCGEDAIFTKDMLLRTRRHLLRKEILGSVAQTESTWYKFHDEQFFIAQGAMYFYLAGPLTRVILIDMMLINHRQFITLSMPEVRKFINNGIKAARLAKKTRD